MQKYGLNHSVTGLLSNWLYNKYQRVMIHEDMNLEGGFYYVMSQGSIPGPDTFIRNTDDT